eukprot:12550419-Ditylum_brightwellii.AAC.1
MSLWKYTNTSQGSKDKYLIELPVRICVPADFYVKVKQGLGAKQVNEYCTLVIEHFIEEFKAALDMKKAEKAQEMQLVFVKFDLMCSIWTATAHAMSMLNVLGALAETAGRAGYC